MRPDRCLFSAMRGSVRRIGPDDHSCASHTPRAPARAKTSPYAVRWPRRPLLLLCFTGLVALTMMLPLGRIGKMPAQAQEKSPQKGKQQITLNGHAFTLPEGFTIELVAGPPLTLRPITIALDEAGRLYVAESSGSNERVTEQVKTRPHSILRLEDSDGDGRYDRRTVFADKMMFPEGTMWLDGSLYVAAPPIIWRLTDTDGDGVADRREEWLHRQTLTGCANDLHGPYLGRDGWIYWCKGAWAEQPYYDARGRPQKSRAAHIFRTPPDRLLHAFPQVPDRFVEAVLTGGMDNPVDVAFSPEGERFMTSTFLVHPQAGLRDGLVHAVYGGVYGKEHEPIYAHPWTAPTVMPVLVQLGASASCGLTCYDSEVFGPEYRGNLFACHFNLRKVTRHVLLPRGATFTTRDEDFLVSDQIDFHPTDVLEDADGSLLVVDTGGWYKLCCPTSQLPKPDVLGAIYRIRRVGARVPEDPRGQRIAWAQVSVEQLAQLLDDPRPAVRQRATEWLAKSGEAAVPALRQVLASSRSPRQRLHAVWTLCQIAGPAARQAVRQALLDSDESVRHAALHSVGLWRDPEAVDELARIVTQASPALRRAAAEALGRIGDSRAVPALLRALADASDRVLQHSLTYALIEIGDASAIRAGLSSGHSTVVRQTLIALEFIRGSSAPIEAVLAALSSSDVELREAAWWLAARHPEWGDRLLSHITQQLRQASTPRQYEDWRTLLVRLSRNQAVQRLLAQLVTDTSLSVATRQTLAQAMAQSGLREAPSAWTKVWLQMLQDDNCRPLWPDVLHALRQVPPSKTDLAAVSQALAAWADRKSLDAELRLRALAALPSKMPLPDHAWSLAVAHLRSDRPVTVRALAVEAVLRSQPNAEQLKQLAEHLPRCSPLEADRLLEAFATNTNEAVAHRLLEALEQAENRASLRPSSIRRAFAKCSPETQRRAEQLLARLDASAAHQKEKLDKLLAALKPGDVRRGQQVFHSAKAACSSCHAIGYLGGRIGPDLTRIGALRSERDLLESIVFPNASFVQSYEPILVATRDGRVFNGLLREDRPEDILLILGPDQQVRIPRSEIEEIQPSKVSLMPSGLDQQLTLEELADLLAFLKSLQ
ncbi:MAG: HEAT repeat domain-containing protein [Gemmatales bacterium]|nr:HEAT repeat domain-containing protein [Gemmatales bacterium]